MIIQAMLGADTKGEISVANDNSGVLYCKMIPLYVKHVLSMGIPLSECVFPCFSYVLGCGHFQ